MRVLFGRSGDLAVAVVFLVIVWVMVAGGLRPIDDALDDFRFASVNRVATGHVVFVDIDTRSLTDIGVWPWPRHVHADILNELMALGASDVVFDIDFSVPSNEGDDAAFAAALEAAGGYAHLAAFQQLATKPGAVSAYNLPLARFRKFADPVAVNVSLDANGMVRTYPFALSIGDETVPSVASVLSSTTGPAGTAFNIDFSIDPQTIDRVSVADLLAHRVASDRIAGNQIILGASAAELRDLFVVPRFGALPGALLQGLAVETLRQTRALQPAGPLAPAAAIVILGLVALFGRHRLPLPVLALAALAISAIAEALAWWLQINDTLLVETAGIHAASFSLAGAGVGAELVRRGRQRLRATRERDAVRRILDRVIADNFDGVVVANVEGRIVSASQFAETILGRVLQGEQIANALPQSLADLLTKALSSHGTQGELILQLGGSGRILEYVVTHSEVDFGDRPSPIACLTFRDITDRRQAEDRLRYLGRHDPLTGALSRTRLVEMINQSIADRHRAAVVIVDLRRFRIINDTLGHAQGDLLLKQVVGRLKSMGPDAVSRLGGDSFALFVPDLSPDKLRAYCESIAQWIAFPYELEGGHQAIIAACAGATTTDLSGHDADVLLSHADMALSAAKRQTGNGIAIFTHEMNRRLQDRQAMDSALRRALANREFQLVYQPQVDIATGVVLGAEALARWTHATLGSVPPPDFIAAAEETGLIVEFGRWVLETACLEAATWPDDLKVAVNVSPVQFELSDILADITAALAVSGLAPHRLEIEITEGIFVRDTEAVTSRLQQLRLLGIGIALDDFGTGYSSLSYLGQLPIDKIKIDQSFVRGLPGDPESSAIVRAVVTLAETLGKKVIAEGIETADQAWILQLMGCTQAQGFYFGRPMSGADIVERVHVEQIRLAATA